MRELLSTLPGRTPENGVPTSGSAVSSEWVHGHADQVNHGAAEPPETEPPTGSDEEWVGVLGASEWSARRLVTGGWTDPANASVAP